jgi:hypothetical protein
MKMTEGEGKGEGEDEGKPPIPRSGQSHLRANPVHRAEDGPMRWWRGIPFGDSLIDGHFLTPEC